MIPNTGGEAVTGKAIMGTMTVGVLLWIVIIYTITFLIRCIMEF